MRLVTGPGEIDVRGFVDAVPCDSLLWTRTDGLGETTAGGRTMLLSGDERIHEEVAGLRFAISPEAFFQTNTEMAERLYGVAGEFAALEGWERLYDLYSGIGTVGLSLAPRAGELWGIEVVEQAVADAIDNARANGIDRAHFYAGDVRLALRELAEKAGRPDVVVVDPPRAGLSAKVVRRDHRDVAQAPRLHLLQPDDARAERRAARRGGLRAAHACGRSTCSRRRPTSSASRCSTASPARPACFSSKIAAISSSAACSC